MRSKGILPICMLLALLNSCEYKEKFDKVLWNASTDLAFPLLTEKKC